MAYKGGRNVAAFADRPGEESGKENLWFLVDCVNYRKVVRGRMGIVFARIAGIVRRLAVLVTPGACCACAERNRSNGQAGREIEMTEASGAWKIRSTSFRARLSDVYQSLLSVDRSSATAETLLPVLDMLLAAVRGIDFLEKDETESRILHLEAFLLFDRDNKDVPGAVHDAAGVLVESLRVRCRQKN